MASTHVTIFKGQELPDPVKMIAGLEKMMKANDDAALGILNVVKSDDAVQLEFFYSKSATIKEASNKKNKHPIEEYEFNKATIIKCKVIFGRGAAEGSDYRVEMTEGPAKAYDQIGQLLTKASERETQVIPIQLSPISIFRTLQHLFEKSGGAELKSIQISDYKPVEGSTIKSTVKIDEGGTEDAITLFGDNAVVLGVTCSFKTALGKVRLTLKDTADFRFSGKEKTKDTMDMLVRKIARGEEVTADDVAAKQTPQAS